MIKAILVDDEPIALENLKDMIKKCDIPVEILASATTIKTAREQISKHNPNLIFLDIELGGKNSFELLEKEENRTYEVIFVTAHDQFGIQAVKKGALDYILKPINKAELNQAIAKASKKINELKITGTPISIKEEKSKLQLTRIAVPTLNGLVFIDLDKIIYCESDGRYTRFHIADNQKKSIVVSKNLGEYESSLPAHQFIRIHHHTIVNINYIEKYVKGRGGYVVLNNGINLPVSTARKSAFFDKLA